MNLSGGFRMNDSKMLNNNKKHNNKMKKTLLICIAILSIFGFIACNEQEDKNPQTIVQKYGNTIVMNGKYKAVFKTNSGVEMEIIDTYVNNELTERLINGKSVDLNNTPNQENFQSISAAASCAQGLSHQYSCVEVLKYDDFIGQGETVYVVLYSNEQPCWYEQQ